MSFYNKNGEQIDRDQWIKLFGNHEYKRIDSTTLNDGVKSLWISTVWLGLYFSNFLFLKGLLIYSSRIRS